MTFLANPRRQFFNTPTKGCQPTYVALSSLDGEIARTHSFTIGGVSGIVGNPAKNQRRTEEEFLAAVQLCTGSDVNVLLLHQGARGAIDDSTGIDPIHETLQTCKKPARPFWLQILGRAVLFRWTESLLQRERAGGIVCA